MTPDPEESAYIGRKFFPQKLWAPAAAGPLLAAHLKSLQEFPPSRGADTLSMNNAVEEAIRKMENAERKQQLTEPFRPPRRKIRNIKTLGGIFFGATLALVGQTAIAASAAEISRDANASLQRLYAKVPAAKAMGARAQAILVFPKVPKAGLGVGGQFGEGALLKGGMAVANYNTAGASVGLQIGAQQYGYAMFFMNANALAQLDKADGFEVGVGPSVVVVDEGMAKSMTTTTAKDDIYAFIFGQKGLMAGLGIQGNKITRIAPK